ncbi:MAG: hypothetical protein L6R35_004247 [Caloplaca aegaea]|nr:MAG: hypothetical protein L6R35_004247 [Caloplaca aegaea]
MLESTFLSRAFGDQGVRLRIRKEPRTLTWVLDNSSHSAWLTGHTGCRKRTAPSLRPEDVPVAFEDPSPASQPRAALQSQRHSVGMGVFNYRRSEMGEPSMKRQRTSVDLGERDLYDTERYSQRPYMQQRGSYGAYPTRDQTSNIYQSAYSQGPPSALSNVSDYSLGHQRTNSSSTSSPFVSPHTEVSGHSWSGANIYYQPPIKETSYSYNPNQYSDMQFGRQNQNQNQLAEPFQRQRSYNMPSSDMASQNMASQNMASQNMASQNMASQNLASRLPVATNFQYARTQEGESNSAIGMYGHISRSLPSTSSMQDPPPRLPSTDQLADYTSPNRQQYHDLQGNNTLPPIDANFASSQIIREGSQQMHHAVLPSIENHTMLSNAGQSVSDEHGQEGYDGQGGYDSSAFNYPPLASHKGLDDG